MVRMTTMTAGLRQRLLPTLFVDALGLAAARGVEVNFQFEAGRWAGHSALGLALVLGLTRRVLWKLPCSLD
jgi:hypothetical protein